MQPIVVLVKAPAQGDTEYGLLIFQGLLDYIGYWTISIFIIINYNWTVHFTC